jgi:hypothetical protein
MDPQWQQELLNMDNSLLLLEKTLLMELLVERILFFNSSLTMVLPVEDTEQISSNQHSK